MSRFRNERSVATVLPASGGRLPSAQCCLMYASTWASASARVSAGVELVEQAGAFVHRPHVRVHLRHGLGRGLDDDVDAVTEHVEVEVGDQGRHLDQGVGHEVETGHLAVDPHESVAHERPPYPCRRVPIPPQDPLSGAA